MTKEIKWQEGDCGAEGITITGTAHERGKEFIDSLMKAVGTGHSTSLSVGYGVAMGEFMQGPVRPLHIVAVKIDEKIHAFSTEEASHMADCIEDAMNTYPDDCFAEVAKTLVTGFRAAVEKTGEVDLKPWRVQ